MSWPASIPQPPDAPTLAEEVASTITHAIGLVLSLIGLPVLIAYAMGHDSVGMLLGAGVFGVALVATYAASTVYHLLQHPLWKRVLRVIDHACIYVLIAGTYTPFVLAYFSRGWTYTLLSLVWGLALAGVVFKVFFIGRFPKLSTGLYVAMGWLVVVAIDPLLTAVPTGCLWWIIAGGLAYTGGVVFYAWNSLPYNHAIWHLFVLAGSACHYVAIVGYVL